MKLNDKFLVREIIDENILIPVGEGVIEFKGLANLTPVGAFICTCLQTDITFSDLIEQILDEYEVDEAEARTDAIEFLDSLAGLNAVDGWPE